MSAVHPPSVERVLAAARPHVAAGTDPEALTAAARALVAEERAALAEGAAPRNAETLGGILVARLAAWTDPRASGLVPVLNATGVLLHTNLGRAAWPLAAIEAATLAAGSPVLLEMDRATGRRGPRSRLAEEHLVALTGAEDALVTVNTAAALALAVGLAGRRGVAVSRGELVEIGGGVRIPEIIRRAGARLVEVGTTNRTRAADFAEPLASGRVAVVLRVHSSNFRIEGFTEAPDPAELAALAHRHDAIVIDDVGSGAFLDTAVFGLAHEPMPAERIAAGADLVTFSGDKLLGGPQAGPIVGRAELIARLRRDPLARAVRPDKVTLAALAATLGIWRAGRARTEIPLWRQAGVSLAELDRRAAALVAALAAAGHAAEARPVRATVGGGSLPGETLPSVALAIGGRGANALATRLRAGDPAVVARVEEGALLADLRTIEPADDPRLLAALLAALRP